MNRCQLTDEAELDLLRVLDYFGSRSETAAAAIERKFIDAFIYLSEWPATGRSREDLRDLLLKTWTVDNYPIVYGPDTAPLQIYAILHGSRDLTSAFAARS